MIGLGSDKNVFCSTSPHQDLLWLFVVFLYALAQSSTTCKVFKRTVFGQSESSLWALLAPVLHSKKLSLSLFQTAKQDIITTGKGYKKEDWLWDKYCKKIYHSYRCAQPGAIDVENLLVVVIGRVGWKPHLGTEKRSGGLLNSKTSLLRSDNQAT